MSEAAPEGVLGAVVERLAGGVRDAVLGGREAPGRRVSGYVLADGGREARAALAGNPGAAPELLYALAGDPDPRVAGAVWDNTHAPREALLRTFGTLPPTRLLAFDPAPGLFASYDRQRRVSVLVEHADPEVVATSLRRLHVNSHSGRVAVILTACLGLLETVGPRAAVSAREGVRIGRHTATGDALRALDNPTDADLLRRGLAEVGHTEALLQRMRHGRDGHALGLMLFAPREPVDWDIVGMWDRAGLITPNARAQLSRQLGCPGFIRTRVAEHGVPLRFRGAVENRPVAEVIADDAPAADVLTAFQYAAQNATARQTEALDVLTTLTRRALGTDVETWHVALSLLPDFAGTVPELLDTARAIAVERGRSR
ncbi:MAG: hypothetical protein HOV68_23735 [Streptomycetaceae bacterium]|nr:hypothetical protein [Streptomycetaceae bacterium]